MAYFFAESVLSGDAKLIVGGSPNVTAALCPSPAREGSRSCCAG